MGNLFGSQPSPEAQQDHDPVPLGMSRMRDIIQKTLQLGLTQHFCLFTLADEFSPPCPNVKDWVDFYYEIMQLSSRLSAMTLGSPNLVIKCLFHYE